MVSTIFPGVTQHSWTHCHKPPPDFPSSHLAWTEGTLLPPCPCREVLVGTLRGSGAGLGSEMPAGCLARGLWGSWNSDICIQMPWSQGHQS